MVDFTVAIPTYNGEHRLPEVLEQLRSQSIDLSSLHLSSFAWEVIVIDNNSQDQTAQVVKAFQSDFPCSLRYCLELQQGAGFARKRAIEEAQSALIGFLDDDNFPDHNWVSSAYQFAQMYPQAGAIASRIQGQFEVEPPPEFKRILPFLAITERGSQPLQYHSAKRVLPPSAGLVVRRSVWLENVPTHTILGGRIDGNMLTGEDTEVLAHIHRSGWEIWYNPAMIIQHQIPAWRLERAYLIPFFRGIGLSRYVTRMSGLKPWQRSVMSLAYTMNDLRKVIKHWLKHHRQLKTNLVAACEMELLISSLFSPFYLWQKGYFAQQK
jgi:glycosyltransferase involved in cell wall biosynthesis